MNVCVFGDKVGTGGRIGCPNIRTAVSLIGRTAMILTNRRRAADTL